MFHAVILSLALVSPSTHEALTSITETLPTAQQPQQDAEFEKRRKDAGNDVDKLWDVYKWCKEQKKDDKGRSVLRQIIKIDPNHEEAYFALERAYRRTEAFEADDARVGRYALKALLSFTLLHRRRLPLAELPDYVERVGIYRDINAAVLHMTPQALAGLLVTELVRARAVRVEDGFVIAA